MKTTNLRYVIFVLALSIATLLGATAALGATITVTHTNDSGAGSLRQAIIDAAIGDTINSNLAGCPCTIQMTTAGYEINKSLNILGPGADQLTIHGGFIADESRRQTPATTARSYRIPTRPTSILTVSATHAIRGPVRRRTRNSERTAAGCDSISRALSQTRATANGS